MENQPTNAITDNLACPNCSGPLRFEPSKSKLVCEYCQTEVAIEGSKITIQEIDYDQYINHVFAQEEEVTVTVVDCQTCGAETTFPPNISAMNCPFCSSSLVLQNATQRKLMQPKGLLPFSIEQKKALAMFQQWLGTLWFAPNNLLNYARQEGKLAGVYIPYWTYDSQTQSHYTGMRGINYVTYEQQTVRDANGNTRTQTVPVTKIRWYPVSGNVRLAFDDILVVASTTLPNEYVYAIEPFDLPELTPFNPKYLSGFRAESYQKNVKEGLGDAKLRMDTFIRQAVNRDIGGDHQQIITLTTDHYNITFKHILLPLWISAFRYNNKIYRFLINGRTGKVSGERPYSIIKIALAVILGLLILGALIYFFEIRNNSQYYFQMQ